jgi:hypothetical protein
MARIQRLVDINDWCLVVELGQRRARLLDVPTPGQLLASVVAEANESARTGRLDLVWQESSERSGYFRLVAHVPLTETGFDQLFNGRAGYRAQYYLSPEEGVLYNRDILKGLASAIHHAYERQPLTIEWPLVERSIDAPHAKIWVFEEKAAFDSAAPAQLNPPRWVANNATTGRKVPLPDHFTLDVKGAFIGPGTDDMFIDEPKLDRPCDLFYRGYT